MRPILLCQLDHSQLSQPYPLYGVVGGHVLDAEEIVLLQPFLSVFPPAIFSLVFSVFHGVSPFR